MAFLLVLAFGSLRGGGVCVRLLWVFVPAVLGSTGLSIGFLLPVVSESFSVFIGPFFFWRSLAAFLEAEDGAGSGEGEKRVEVPLGGIGDGV